MGAANEKALYSYSFIQNKIVNLECFFKYISHVFLLETRLHEAGCFHAISQNSQFTVNLVQLAKQGINEDLTVPILKAMGHINILQPEVILLYTSKESMELMLQQVITCIYYN